MSNYTRTIIFADKDALITGDPNKVARGVELDVEYDAAQDAINSKYDINNLANNSEAIDGTSNSVLMTPLRTQEYVTSVLPDAGEANTASSEGGGVSIVLDKDGINLPFRSLEGGTDIQIDINGDVLTINSTYTGTAGDLPPGDVGQGIYNIDGAVAYAPWPMGFYNGVGVSMGAAGDVSPPEAVLEIWKNNILMRTGSTISFDDPTNSGNFGTIFSPSSGLLQMSSPAGGQVDIISSQAGANPGVKLVQENQTCVRTLSDGAGVGYTQLMYNDSARLTTVNGGVNVTGVLGCSDPAAAGHAVTLNYYNNNTVQTTGVQTANGTKTWGSRGYFNSGANFTTGFNTNGIGGWQGRETAEAFGSRHATFFYNGSTQTGNISSNVNSTQYNTISDGRLKRNMRITQIDAIAALQSVDVLDYEMRDDPTHTVATGFIAQDMEKVCPTAVHVAEDGTYSMDYGLVTPVLWRQNRLQQDHILALEQRILALEINI